MTRSLTAPQLDSSLPTQNTRKDVQSLAILCPWGNHGSYVPYCNVIWDNQGLTSSWTAAFGVQNMEKGRTMRNKLDQHSYEEYSAPWRSYFLIWY